MQAEPTIPAGTGSRRLIGHVLLDLTLIIVATIAMSLVVSIFFLLVRGLQAGLTPAEIANLTPDAAIQLLGVGGVLVILVLQNILFVAVPIVRVRFLRHEPLGVLGLQAQRPLRLLLIGLGIGIIALMANALLSTLFLSFGIRQNQAAQYPLYQGQYLAQILFAIGAALIVPFGEEVLFRGYLFGSLDRIDAPWSRPAAYLISAAVFALAHMLAASEGQIVLLTTTFLLGLVLAWVFQRTGSVFPCFVAHATNNGVALLALLTCVNNPLLEVCLQS